jgi:hypothetical protein
MFKLFVGKARWLALICMLVLSCMLMASCASVMESLEEDTPDRALSRDSQAGKRVPVPPTVKDFGAED